ERWKHDSDCAPRFKKKVAAVRQGSRDRELKSSRPVKCDIAEKPAVVRVNPQPNTAGGGPLSLKTNRSANPWSADTNRAVPGSNSVRIRIRSRPAASSGCQPQNEWLPKARRNPKCRHCSD